MSSINQTAGNIIQRLATVHFPNLKVESMVMEGCVRYGYGACCWVTRGVHEARDTHQSPKPAFFTVDMPTLDRGKGRCVGVLREK